MLVNLSKKKAEVLEELKDRRRLIAGMIIIFVALILLFRLFIFGEPAKIFYSTPHRLASWGDWSRFMWTLCFTLAGLGVAAISASFNTKKGELGEKFWFRYLFIYPLTCFVIAIGITVLFNELSTTNNLIFYIVVIPAAILLGYKVDSIYDNLNLPKV